MTSSHFDVESMYTRRFAKLFDDLCFDRKMIVLLLKGIGYNFEDYSSFYKFSNGKNYYVLNRCSSFECCECVRDLTIYDDQLFYSILSPFLNEVCNESIVETRYKKSISEFTGVNKVEAIMECINEIDIKSRERTIFLNNGDYGMLLKLISCNCQYCDKKGKTIVGDFNAEISQLHRNLFCIFSDITHHFKQFDLLIEQGKLMDDVDSIILNDLKISECRAKIFRVVKYSVKFLITLEMTENGMKCGQEGSSFFESYIEFLNRFLMDNKNMKMLEDSKIHHSIRDFCKNCSFNHYFCWVCLNDQCKLYYCRCKEIGTGDGDDGGLVAAGNYSYDYENGYCSNGMNKKKSFRVRYCGRSCQKKDWIYHKSECPLFMPTSSTKEKHEDLKLCSVEWRNAIEVD